jgi:CxxC-x17-CxxC domain-containing protein
MIAVGETNFRNTNRRFGIKDDDRRRHFYLIGKTGVGKTNAMETMAIQDMENGDGLAFIDPHGEAAERLLEFVPSHRLNDVVYFDPSDTKFPIAFNIMETVGQEHRHLVASGLMGAFKKIWPDVWSARMEYILNNTILALLEYPNATLLGVNRMLADPTYRERVVKHITDPVIKAFWQNEFARYNQRYETEATGAIQNKVGQFISAPLIRNIIGQTKSSINMRHIMDEQKILIINLSKGKIGEDNSMLLGSLLVTKLQLAAMSRVDIPEDDRKDFFLYVDEFQNFATKSFVTILSEARKYRLSLILGHQYITQMEETVRDAVFGNIGSLMVFRVGAPDAEFLEREFEPDFQATDFVNLPKYNAYIKLMVDGVSSRPFSAKTIAPRPTPENNPKEKVINLSRERYGTASEKVEEKIHRWIDEIPSDTTPIPGLLYDAVCSECKKEIKVPFPPDGKRPIYCKTCRKKKLKDKSEEKPKENKLASNLRKVIQEALHKENEEDSGK